MKILISACHFTPDPIGGGKFSGEMAEWLAARGHQVRAVVGVPYYPQWSALKGYPAGRYRRERVRGVEVLRCPMWIPGRPSGLARMIQYATLAMTSAPPLLWWAARWKPDVVWTTMPPFSGMPMALLAAGLAGAPSWLHVQDFEVDAAFELGMFKGGTLRNAFLDVERRLMSGYRVVSSITPRMLQKLEAKKVLSQKILFPNWVDLDVIYPLAEPLGLRDTLDIPRSDFVALYSGNLGEKQGVDDLVAVARLLSDERRFTMVICGDGAGRERLARIGANLGNIRFLPLQPVETFNGLLNMADVHLLPQKAQVADLVMPSKLPGMLASGRPVIAGAVSGTQLAQEVEGCGIVGPPGDPAAMAAAIRGLLADPHQCSMLGKKAAKRAIVHWSKDVILAHFEEQLQGLAKTQRNA